VTILNMGASGHRLSPVTSFITDPLMPHVSRSFVNAHL
jgi:hypothetical protein